jgi:tight adherence protein C
VLAIAAAIIIGSAVFFVMYIIQISAEKSAAEDRLGLNWNSEDKKTFKPPFYIAFTRPLLKGSYLDLAAGYWSEASLQKWKVKLISAGLGKYIEAKHFVASKFYLTLIVGFLFFLMHLFMDDPPSLMWTVIIVGAMFFIPNLHVDSLRKLRQQEIRIAMPYVVDLLTLSIEAGLDFMGAIGRVVEKAPTSPLLEELSILLKDIQLGKTRAQAMRAMSDRIDMQEMNSFVAVLISSDQMGASIGNVLRAQSDSMRNERLSKAEKLGAQASQKILIPLIFFIMPAVFLIIFGPFVLQIVGG